MELDSDSFQINFASTIKALYKHSSNEFERRGIAISPEQNFILKALAKKEDAIQTELADYLQIDKSAVMRHIDILENKGMVNRVNDAQDRRKKNIVLTSLGINELEKCEAIFTENFQKILNGISEAEMAIFIQVLNKLKENSQS